MEQGGGMRAFCDSPMSSVGLCGVESVGKPLLHCRYSGTIVCTYLSWSSHSLRLMHTLPIHLHHTVGASVVSLLELCNTQQASVQYVYTSVGVSSIVRLNSPN